MPSVVVMVKYPVWLSLSGVVVGVMVHPWRWMMPWWWRHSRVRLVVFVCENDCTGDVLAHDRGAGPSSLLASVEVSLGSVMCRAHTPTFAIT